jgi:hypothetical protein
MKKVLSVKQRIKDVLVVNNDMWLNHKEVAELAYGEAYIRDTANGLNAKIARNINSAIFELSNEEKLFVVSKNLPRTNKEINDAMRRNSSNTASTLSPYKSYKIADAEDKADVLIDVDRRKSLIDGLKTRLELHETNLKYKQIIE